MIENYVKVNNQKDILKIGLTDMNDKPILDEKGEVVYWQFDLGDIELPLKFNKCEAEHKQNIKNLKHQFFLIDKKTDKKGKYLLSANEEEKAKALRDFYRAEEKTLDLFLGEGGVKKFLDGRGYYWDMFNDIASAIEPILPLLEKSMSSIEDRIKEKYENKESAVLG